QRRHPQHPAERADQVGRRFSVCCRHRADHGRDAPVRRLRHLPARLPAEEGGADVTDRAIGIALRVYIGLGFLFIFTPIIALIVFSFNVDRFPSLPWQGFSTRWYSAVLSDQEVISSFKNSLFVGVIVGGISTFLGATAAYFLTRWRLRIQTP